MGASAPFKIFSKSVERFKDRLFRGFAFASTLLVILVVIAMGILLLVQSRPAIEKFGFIQFIFRDVWNPVEDEFGGLYAVVGTLLSSAIAIAIATPVSIGIAIFITELSPSALRGIFSSVIELLAAIPSIIYGMWGLFVLAPILKHKVEPWMIEHLGFIPFFDGKPYGIGLFNAGIVLAVMIIPYISSIVREVFSLVPDIMKEAAYAVGATRWEVVRHVVIPYTRSGIMAGIILGLGRALGETMAVTFVIGNAYRIPSTIYEPSITIASSLANEFTEATTDLHLSSLFLLAFILFLITFVVMSIGRLIIMRMGRHVA